MIISNESFVDSEDELRTGLEQQWEGKALPLLLHSWGGYFPAALEITKWFHTCSERGIPRSA